MKIAIKVWLEISYSCFCKFIPTFQQEKNSENRLRFYEVVVNAVGGQVFWDTLNNIHIALIRQNCHTVQD